jgi:hypothetical protein
VTVKRTAAGQVHVDRQQRSGAAPPLPKEQTQVHPPVSSKADQRKAADREPSGFHALAVAGGFAEGATATPLVVSSNSVLSSTSNKDRRYSPRPSRKGRAAAPSSCYSRSRPNKGTPRRNQ